MRTISFTVTDQHITCLPVFDLVGNTKNYVKATFTFNSAWDNMLKVAIFTANSKQYPVIIENNECIIPSIAMCGEFFDAGVYGGAGETRLTTDTVRVRVDESVRQKPPYEMINMYEDLQEKVSELEDEDDVLDAKIDAKQNITLSEPIVVGSITCETVEEVLVALSSQETVYDAMLSDVSENAVQNKVVKNKFDSVDSAVADNTSHRGEKIASSAGSHGFRVNPSTHKPQYYDPTEEEWVNTAGAIDVDAALSNVSENPVQNKVIKDKLDSVDSAVSANTAHRESDIPSQSGAHGFRVDATGKTQYYDESDEEWKDAKSVVDVDSALSDVSTNPVQNKKVKEAIDDINDTLGDTSVNNTSGAFGFRVNQSTKRGQYYNESTEVWENIEDSGGGGGSVTVDDTFSTLSENPVQNKVITNKINSMDTEIAASATHDATGITESGGAHGLKVDASGKAKYYDETNEEWVNVVPDITIDAALSDASTNPVQNKKVKEAIDAHTGGKVTDANGIHGFRVNNEKGQYYDGTEWKDLAGGSGGGVEVGDVSSFAETHVRRSATLTWIDPTDFVVDGRVIAAWAKTVIVRKTGYVPSSPSDGTVIVTETTRNQYSSTGFSDTTLSYGQTFYYRAFVYTTQGVITNGSSVSVTPARSEIFFMPAQLVRYTYTGSEITAEFSDQDKFVITGTTSGTNAGTYNVSFTPDEDYIWSESIQTLEGLQPQETWGSFWTLHKADGDATLSDDDITLNAQNLSEQILVSDATGTVSVSSSDTTVATATISNDTITINSVNGRNGSATITVSIAASANYTEATKTITVSCAFTKIYGASWDGTATTAWSRTDEAANFTDPVPAVNNGSGSSPFDNLMPWSGMTVSERTGGKMVAVPKFWYKLTQNGNGIKVQIADGAVEGYNVSPAHMDRGDGSGERDVIYVGRYHCASDYKSKTGVKPVASITRSAARSNIHALGNKIWQIDFATRFTLWLLYIVEFANWNSQDKIGYGCGNNSATENMGYTDSMQYHTGTTQSNRTTYGLGTQYRNIEGLWDNVYDWIDGCYYDSNGLNLIKNPSNFSDSSGGSAVGIPSSGYPSKFAVSNTGGFPVFYPTEASGSETTYSCDNWNFGAASPCLCAGGGYSRSGNRGLFCVYCSSASDSSAGRGCRLLELP